MKNTKKYKVLEIINDNPHISLREICFLMKWKNVGNAVWAVNSLEREGLVKKMGKNTRKWYLPLKKIDTEVVYYDANLKILPNPCFIINGTSHGANGSLVDN